MALLRFNICTMNDVPHSGLTALNAASSGQGETDNLGSVARVRRERFLAADLDAALGAGLLDLPRALGLLIAFALLEGHVIGTVSQYAGERGFALGASCAGSGGFSGDDAASTAAAVAGSTAGAGGGMGMTSGNGCDDIGGCDDCDDIGSATTSIAFIASGG
jgi:hypothetical protein